MAFYQRCIETRVKMIANVLRCVDCDYQLHYINSMGHMARATRWCYCFINWNTRLNRFTIEGQRLKFRAAINNCTSTYHFFQKKKTKLFVDRTYLTGDAHLKRNKIWQATKTSAINFNVFIRAYFEFVVHVNHWINNEIVLISAGFTLVSMIFIMTIGPRSMCGGCCCVSARAVDTKQFDAAARIFNDC